MAYASLLSLTQTIEQTLQSHQSRDESQLALHELMRSLHEKFSNLLSFLESSPKNRVTISSLEGKIRDITFEAEDLIESHITKQIRSKRVRRAKRDAIQEDYKKRLQIVLEKLDSISEEVDHMKEKNDRGGMQPSKFDDVSVGSILESDSAALQMDGVDETMKVYQRISSGTSLLEHASTKKGSMIGFENDMLRIKDLLTGSSTKLETISIVGMGGIGKTTLARNIYNDSMVNRRFDNRAWITVSQEYDVVKLLADLLRSMGKITGEIINANDEQKLKLELYQNLKQRRYLIVMDDVWDANVLEKFRNIFPDDNIGSRIIMTSRSSNVVSSDNSCSHIHRLNFLSSDQSWNLLQQKVFGKGYCPDRDLENIGRRIAENCKGLALALVAVGGALHKAEKTLAHWEYVAENMKSLETGNYDYLMEILSWSYKQLPHHLRACFLYMGVFPEDSLVHVFQLIMLWVANGFIKPVLSKTLEEVAMEYLEDLINRNLIMVRERSYDDGEIKTCAMHDLVRDLCIKRGEEEKFLVVVDQAWKLCPGPLKRYHHLTITGRINRLREFREVYDSSFRSLLCFKFVPVLENLPFQLLKVLDVHNTIFCGGFPVKLVQLVNLRYIFLKCKGGGEIPMSIFKLRYLQTLIVFQYAYYPYQIILDLRILNMPQLRHLWVEGCIFRHSCSGRNDNLQTLCGIRNFIFTKDAIGIFPNLKKLGITYSEIGWKSSGHENLVHLSQLEFLKLRISESFPVEMNLALPVKLRKLSLKGKGSIILSQRQMSMIGLLPNLEVLVLTRVKFNEEEGWKTNEGEFPKLKLLCLKYPDAFSWDLDGTHFPSLECLTLYVDLYRNQMKHLPSQIGDIPNLRVINLHTYSPSLVASARKIQKEQLEDWGNDTLQVQVHSTNTRNKGFRYNMMNR